MSDFGMDPRRPGRAFYANWFGVWFTDNVWATSTTWTTYEMGHEELVVLTLGSSPSCPALVSSQLNTSV